MRKRWMTSFAVMGAMCLISGKTMAGKPVPDTALKVELRDAAGDGLKSDGMKSLSGLPFDYVHGLPDNVIAILQGSSGNYRFETQYDTSVPVRRHLCFDFGAQPVPFSSSAFCVEAVQAMLAEFDATANARIQDLRYGQSVKKRTRIEWSDASVQYYLGYGTDVNGDLVADTPPVTVTCTAPPDPSLPCATWTMTPDGEASLSRAQVLNPGGKLGPQQLVGYYDMPFLGTLQVK